MTKDSGQFAGDSENVCGKVALWAPFEPNPRDLTVYKDLALFARVLRPLIWGRISFMARIWVLFTGRLPKDHFDKYKDVTS